MIHRCVLYKLYPINISHCVGYFHEENDQHESHELLEFESLGLIYFSFRYLCFNMISELDPMASSSSNIVNPLLGQAVSEKLTKSNHVLWNAQVWAMIRGARLIGFLTGDAKAPDEKIKSKGADGMKSRSLTQTMRIGRQPINRFSVTCWRLSLKTSSSKLPYAQQQSQPGRRSNPCLHRKREHAP
jgi:hypothetical protein